VVFVSIQAVGKLLVELQQQVLILTVCVIDTRESQGLGAAKERPVQPVVTVLEHSAHWIGEVEMMQSRILVASGRSVKLLRLQNEILHSASTLLISQLQGSWKKVSLSRPFSPLETRR